MSFVSINAQKDFISVMSDGLVCFSHSDGRLERLEENFKKFFQISSKQFVAVTGTKSVLDYYSQTIPFLEESYNLKELAEKIYSELMVFQEI